MKTTFVSSSAVSQAMRYSLIRSQSELVILVTPYLATPTNKKPELPTDRMQFANDAEAIFLGHIETMYGVGPAGTRGSYDGSVGFLLD